MNNSNLLYADDDNSREIAVEFHVAGAPGFDDASIDLTVIALLEAIANDKQIAQSRRAMGGAARLPREEPYWSACGEVRDELEEAIARGLPLAAVFGCSKRRPPDEHLTVTQPETRGTIVIAEDDDVTRTLLQRVLTRAGFTVHACENGQLAYDEVRRKGADVILLDWMMPVMDGPTAVKHLKGNIDTRGIPVLMLTMQSNLEDRVVAYETGVQDFLTKPFEPRELVARIDQQLRWRRMLAVDASPAFARERLERYRPVRKRSAVHRIWGEAIEQPLTGDFDA